MQLDECESSKVALIAGPHEDCVQDVVETSNAANVVETSKAAISAQFSADCRSWVQKSRPSCSHADSRHESRWVDPGGSARVCEDCGADVLRDHRGDDHGGGAADSHGDLDGATGAERGDGHRDAVEIGGHAGESGGFTNRDTGERNQEAGEHTGEPELSWSTCNDVVRDHRGDDHGGGAADSHGEHEGDGDLDGTVEIGGHAGESGGYTYRDTGEPDCRSCSTCNQEAGEHTGEPELSWSTCNQEAEEQVLLKHALHAGDSHADVL